MKHNLKSRISVLLTILMILMAMPTSVFAASINDLNVVLDESKMIKLDDNDMKVKITNADVEVGTGDIIDPTKAMAMRVDFSIPDTMTDIRKGDYLEVSLPKYLQFSKLNETAIKMQVAGNQEVVLGHVTINNNIARLTFTDVLEHQGGEDGPEYTNVGGWFSATLSFDEKMVQVPQDTVVFTIFGKEFKINVKAEPIDPGYITIAKTGKADFANAEIAWTVTLTPSEPAKTFDGYVFKDLLPASVSFVEDSFAINPSTVDKNNLKFSKNDPTDAETIEYTFGEKITGVQTITYKTKIKNIAANNNKDIEVTNHASISNADTTTSTAFTVKGKPVWVQKYGSYQVTDHSVNWTIRVNTSKAKLNNVIVTDVLAPELTLRTIKIGKIILTDDTTKPQYYTLDGRTVKIHLGNIQQEVVINMNTKLDNKVQEKVQNKATLNWEDEGSSISGGAIGSSDIATGEINTFIKSGFIEKTKFGSYDYKKNEMGWKITINKAKQEINNATVVEVFIYNEDEVSSIIKVVPNKKLLGKYEAIENNFLNFNQKYVDKSVIVSGSAVTKIGDDEVFTEKGQYKVKTITLQDVKDKPVIKAQIVEVYLGNLDATETEEVILKTNYTDKKAYGMNEKRQNQKGEIENVKYSMVNRAFLFYGDGNSNLYGDTTETHYRAVIEKDCKIPYNYVDRTITWRLYVNHNALDIENGIITDTLPKYWDVDGEDFFEIYEGGKVILDGQNATIAEGVKLTPDKVKDLMKEVEVTEKGGIKTIQFKFNKISEPYVILIKTKLSEEGAANQFKENNHVYVKNTAGISGSSIVNTQEDSEYVGIWNNLISKSGSMDKDSKGNYTGDATWTIDVNRNAIHLPTDELDKVYVIDTLQKYLEPKMNGGKYEIRMWEMKLTPDGRWDKDTEVDQETLQSGITYANKELRIKLPKIDGSYQIELVTRITSDTVTQINNTASLEGVNTNLVSKNETIKIEYAEGGAWANLAGKIIVTKTAEDGKAVLEGATFELYELSSDANPMETLKYTKTTDKNGKITFGRLKTGKYKLVEVAAPIGYEINPNEASRIIDIDTSNSTAIQNITVMNKTLTRAIQLLKTDELGNPLAGAEFTLYKDAISEKGILAKQTSISNGSVTFSNVKMGTYYIAETKTPTGYLKAATSSAIKAVVNQSGSITYFSGENFGQAVTGVPTIKNSAYKCNIDISKVNKEGAPLQGAEFGLYDSNEKLIEKAVSEGELGIAKFSNIRFGNYTIKEISAPTGYIVSNSTLVIAEKDFIENNVTLAFKVENEKQTSSNGGNHNTPNKKDEVKQEEPIIIKDDLIPAGKTDDLIPAGKAEENTPAISIDDEKVPQGKLPSTGGIPQELFFGLGSGLVALGSAIKRKMNKTK